MTERYYSSSDITSQGIEYYWWRVNGGGEEPTESHLCGFCDLLCYIRRRFPASGVVVHCTHGVNRTGTFVCFYLFLVGGMAPEDALKLFAESRGHSIDKVNLAEFVLSLSKRISSAVLNRYRLPTDTLDTRSVDLYVGPLRPSVRRELVYLSLAGSLTGEAEILSVEPLQQEEEEPLGGVWVAKVSLSLVGGASQDALLSDRVIRVDGERVDVVSDKAAALRLC